MTVTEEKTLTESMSICLKFISARLSEHRFVLDGVVSKQSKTQYFDFALKNKRSFGAYRMKRVRRVEKRWDLLVLCLAMLSKRQRSSGA